MKTVKDIGGCIKTLNLQGSVTRIKNEKIYYAVGRGKNTGIYDSWEACKILIRGVSNAKYKKFNSYDDAKRFVNFWKKFSNSKTQAFMQLKDNAAVHNDKYSSEATTLKEPNLFHKSSSIASYEDFSDGKLNQSNVKASVKEVNNSLKKVKNVKYTVTELGSSLKELKDGLKSNLVSKANPNATLCTELSRPKEEEKDAINLEEVGKIEERLTKRKTNRKLTKNDSSEILKCSSDDCKVASDSSNKAKNEMSNEVSLTFNKDKDNYVKVYTDGSALFNGKPNARAGLGVWFGLNHPLNLSQAVEGPPTCNMAEIEAAQMAVRLASNAGIKNLKIITDSQYLFNSVTKWIHKWQKNGWILSSKKPVKHRKELENLYSETYKLNILWEKVAAHSRILGNESAHKLARKGVPKDNDLPSTKKADSK